jgi:hypothetical protein
LGYGEHGPFDHFPFIVGDIDHEVVYVRSEVVLGVDPIRVPYGIFILQQTGIVVWQDVYSLVEYAPFFHCQCFKTKKLPADYLLF